MTGFVGVIKQRYSDFIVREVDLQGQVAMLKSTDARELENQVFRTDRHDNADSMEVSI